MAKKKTKGKGEIPENCPNCKAKKVNWDWGDTENYDSQSTQEVTCPECDKTFIEISEVVSWEEQKERI